MNLIIHANESSDKIEVFEFNPFDYTAKLKQTIPKAIKSNINTTQNYFC